jgi:hypothetical protein
MRNSNLLYNKWRSDIQIKIKNCDYRFIFFINFRIRTFAINIIPEFSANIRAIRKNIKIIKTIMNSRKKEIIPPNIIKKIKR